MNEKALGLIILASIVGVTAGAYVTAWRAKSLRVRQGALWVVAVIFAVAGLWGIWAYAIPISLEGLRDPAVPRWEAMIVGLIIVAICVIPCGIALRFVRSAMRKDTPS